MEFGVLLDVTVSLLAVVLAFSVAASAINEFIADNLLRLRGKMLWRAIAVLLEDRTAKGAAAVAVKDFYDHPDIKRLKDRWRLPSAIEPRRYAVTVLKILADREAKADAAKAGIAARKDKLLTLLGPTVGGAREAEVRKALERIASGAGTLVDELDLQVDALERDFNEMMDRVSGWYVRRTKLTLFVIGLLLAGGANVDVLGYADRMIHNAEARENAAAFAQTLGEDELQKQVAALIERQNPPGNEGGQAANPPEEEAAGSGPDALADQWEALTRALSGLDAKVGWQCVDAEGDASPWWTSEGLAARGCGDGKGWGLQASQILGWFIIGLAVTLGAQFWFDLFQRLVRIRTAGRTGGAVVKAAKADLV